MKTSNEFMCISYESDVMYVKTMLDLLIKTDSVSFYAFVVHKGNATSKSHVNVFLDPCGEIDVNFVLAMLGAKEYSETDWISWGNNFDSDEIVGIGIQNRFAYLLEV